ncbi:proline racemase family protein [Acidipila rosea]|uniref:4-hydroxyproline epimerase n=1 Tax=Acidipila rosea TaxID=768535 RepID=A0A4R1LFY3_9BACT|nr:proline racemase family protein [Acidipila rosea]TCK75599.1 4-hydroxyproline epimerase [Acidipila rosea]
MASPSHTLSVIDSHTGGEPTRLVIGGGPDLGSGSMAERLARFRADHDCFRSAVVNEPRGSDVIVGGLLCEPQDPASATGVIFFNNVGYLGMCGHGTIGVIASLAHLGRIGPGRHLVETSVGAVEAVLHPSGSVTVENVASYRSAANVAVDVPGFGVVRGDIAWGGNWFFLIGEHPFDLALENVDSLTDFAWRVRQSLAASGITGDNGGEIDHVEIFSPSATPGVNSRNFVLCPGKAYDRSPCGTGTSAKMACLYADGKLAPGQPWRQQGILGTVFEGSIRLRDGQMIPSITGQAYITAESSLLVTPGDPFAWGIRR